MAADKPHTHTHSRTMLTCPVHFLAQYSASDMVLVVVVVVIISVVVPLDVVDYIDKVKNQKYRKSKKKKILIELPTHQNAHKHWWCKL